MGQAKETDYEPSWRGSPLKDIYRGLEKFDLRLFPAVTVSFNSTVLYEHPVGVVDNKKPPKPFVKSKEKEKWDSLHVQLPSTIECQCSADDTDDEDEHETPNRWKIIKDAFSEPINTVQDFQNAILTYNPDFKEQWRFQALHTLLIDDLKTEDVEEFFKDLLPRIIKLALQLPDLIQAPIPLLRQCSNHAISLTQQQVSCLLANAFLCTFPYRSSAKRWRKKHADYSNYSDINFHGLFQSNGAVVTEKLKCLLNYFRRVCPNETDASNVPTGVVTFARQSLFPYDFPDWETCEIPIEETKLHIDAAGGVENGIGLLQVDFANKFIGGSVLGLGCAQEEIRFSTHPELIVAKLFCECLLPEEALFMIGCEQYNNHSGYESNFKWAGNHIDNTPRDSSKRRQIAIVAIDATNFREKTAQQYKEKFLYRELNKAYVGFWLQCPKQAPGIATGNWGCGSYCGDPRLKALIQIMAACVTERPLAYFTFSDTALRDDINELYQYLKERKATVCDIYNSLNKFGAHNIESHKLYKFIKWNLRQPKVYYYK